MVSRLAVINLLALALLFCGCAQAPSKTVTLSLGPGHYSLQAEIANTTASRERGLMGRPSLAENAGMLFVFDSPAPQTFWMAGTLIPLEILYLNDNGTIVSRQEMVPCPSSNWSACPLYPSGQPVRYALELSANFSARHNLSLGQTIQIPNPS